LEMLDNERARSVTEAQAAKLSQEELAGKIVTGVLHLDENAPEFQQVYAASARAQAEKAGTRVQIDVTQKPPVGEQK